MDQKKAELLLQLKNYRDCHEAYESIVFEIKSMLLNQGVIPKVMRKRQERLLIIHEAYLLLSAQKETTINIEAPVVKGTNWESLFLEYEKNKSKLKRQIALSNDARLISIAIDRLILNQLNWSAYFDFDYSQVGLPTLGKEMDSMQLLKLFKEHKDTLLEKLPKSIKSEFGRILKNLEAEK
ncbi:hypothetical protein OAF64_00415 [Crocinitomicaceae bacterium]|nr:hypothetical protein [Crocinitomicaceae bacterium]